MSFLEMTSQSQIILIIALNDRISVVNLKTGLHVIVAVQNMAQKKNKK